MVNSKIKLVCECVPWHGRAYMRFFYCYILVSGGIVPIDKIN